MTFIRTSTTFFALIFSVQIAIASGPTLLEDETANRAFVQAAQIKVEEGSKSWLGFLWTKVKGAFSSSQKTEVSVLPKTLPLETEALTSVSWEEKWTAIEAHVVKMTQEHYLNGVRTAFVMHQKLKSKPLLEDKLKQLLYSAECSEDMVDDCMGTSNSKYVHDVFDWQLLEDMKKLNVVKFIGLMLMEDPEGTGSYEFLEHLYNFSRYVADRRYELSDPDYFLQGQKNARLLLEIAQLEPAEDRLPTLMNKVLKFYVKQDGGELTSYSKGALNHLGIPYPEGRKEPFNIPRAAAVGGLIILTLGNYVTSAAAQFTQPLEVATACRNTALECLSAFGPTVGYGTQVSYFTQRVAYNFTLDDMLDPGTSSAYGTVNSDIANAPTYSEISNWLNTASPNVTRVLNSNGVTGFKGCDYSPLNVAQHTETTYNGIPTSAKSNIVTTTGSGSINPYYYELTQPGDMWLLMTQHTDNQTIVGSIVFRPASGTPFIQYYANMVMTPQRVANRVKLSALQSAYVAPGTPSRVISQQDFTADQLQASYYTGSVASNDCVTSITIDQFLAQNGIDLGALISCMQNSGYNPLSCRTISNPLGGYIQLLNYYMMNGGSELHKVVVSGSTYDHYIYTSTGASNMSRIRHTFDWKAQGASTTTTTAVAQSFSALQGTLLTNGGVRRFAIFYYGNDPAESAIVVKVDENGAVDKGAFLGADRCARRKRSAEEEQPQTKIEVVERRARLNIDEFNTRQAESQTFVDSLKGWFGFGSPIAQPHHAWGPEKWYRFWQSASLAGGKPVQGITLYQGDEGLEHNFLFSMNNGQFEVFCRSANSSNAVANNGKVKVM